MIIEAGIIEKENACSLSSKLHNNKIKFPELLIINPLVIVQQPYLTTPKGKGFYCCVV